MIFAVTLFATRAEPAVVPVVLAMARYARRRQLVAIEVAGVAGVALDLRVGGSQWKFRRHVMIEMNRTPLALVVAAFAFRAIPSGVDVLNLVTRDACRADVLITFADMACCAGDGTMRLLERKPCFVVIK